MLTLKVKERRLRRYVESLDSVIVAFSGGVDSTLVLKVARDVLGESALAVTADSPSVPRSELREAQEIAREIGARHEVIATHEVKHPVYRSNPVNRCYFCKFELYTHLRLIARREGTPYIANGTNLDDLGDFRPGLQAADEFHVISPLKQAELTKADVRRLAQKLGLRIWEKPASPCLASRIPYGSPVTTDKLATVERAEAYLKSLNFKDIRVRHFGSYARLEFGIPELPRAYQLLPTLQSQFQQFGFHKIELTEFRSGSLNSLLDIDRHRSASTS